jgi:hypothetical protein
MEQKDIVTKILKIVADNFIKKKDLEDFSKVCGLLILKSLQ